MKHWWQTAVVYQIYPRSFQDSNGDGIGDLKGIIDRLDYLQTLGIEAIWLSPVCKSPQDDNGYDISDYMDIDPMFGDLETMDLLIEEAKKRNIRILVDLVLNHCSDEHPWFIEAKKSKDNPYHDFFVWQDGVKGELPNDMRSCFCGPAWEWNEELGQYYFHQFSVKQPDLNWENEAVRKHIYDMINFWIDRGVGGFRLDVIDLIGKEPMNGITGNGPKLHDYIQEMNEASFGKKELLTVGETWGVTPEIAKKFSNPDESEFSMVFQFEHIGLDQQEGKDKWDLAPLDFIKLKQVFSKWQTELEDKGWNSLFWNNHDLPRIVSRWGNDKEYRVESAKMLATILHCMKGTPYIYQGEELGMTNVEYSIEEYRDIELLNMYKERMELGYDEADVMKSIYVKGRDNARTPMQWDDSSEAGFTTGTPWIKVNPNYKEINAASQVTDENSIFHYYKKLIAMRKKYAAIPFGSYEMLLPEDEQIYAYKRELDGVTITVVCNFKETEITFDLGEVIKGRLELCNYSSEGTKTVLRPYEARVYINE